jgi:hypothetical protein
VVLVSQTLSNLAATYTGYGSWVGLASGAPGSTSTPSSEASGAGYTRSNTTWSQGVSGVQTGSAVTITVAGLPTTYSYVLLSSASSGNNMYDNNTITNVTMGATGSIVVTPTFTQT